MVRWSLDLRRSPIAGDPGLVGGDRLLVRGDRATQSPPLLALPEGAILLRFKRRQKGIASQKNRGHCIE